MKLLNKINVKTRLIIGFFIMVVLFVGYGLFTIRSITTATELTSTLYEHPFQVSNAALMANVGVYKLANELKNILLEEPDKTYSKEIHDIKSCEELVLQQLDIVKNRILGEEGKKLEKETREEFINWIPVIDDIIQLIENGNKQGAIQLREQKGMVTPVENKMIALNSYARRKADGFMKDAEKVENQLYYSTVVMMVLFILISIIIVSILSASIMFNLNLLKNTMSEITKTGNFMKSDVVGNNEFTEIAEHFNLLIDKLEKIFWLRNGLNELNNQVSGYQSLEQMTKKCIQFISRYTDACIGAFYCHNSKSSLCELKASFAFVERKYLSHQFKSGEGIVGQVMVEKEPILLTQIKEDEAVAVSGTIVETPKHIYAFPLIYNTNLCGVIEIGSFHSIDSVKKEFLDSAARIIASSIYTIGQNEEIKELLEFTKKMNITLEQKSEELNERNERLTDLNKELEEQTAELNTQSEELRAQKDELEEQRNQVEEADRLKSEFLSNMSHELRTPLNSVLALSQLMIAKGTGNDVLKEKEYLQVIERNGRHLLSLINDILDLSKIEAGRMDIFAGEFSPNQVVESVLEITTPLANEKGLSIHVQLEENIIIRSDEAKIRQILLNLISNAIKFTDQGKIDIRVFKSNGTVSFSVSDTGIGIRTSYIPYIFSEFRQADGSTTRRHQGTGLGLAISKKLSNLLGGDIRVESTEGVGSTFILEIPVGKKDNIGLLSSQLSPSDSKINMVRPLPMAMSEFNKPKQNTVLVIDDDIQVCSILKEYLTQSGYEVAIAHHGKAGLELARQIKPFAITLDIIMPEMDGWEVIRELKSSSDTAHIPVIMVSVSNDRETGVALGATGYVLKPIDQNALFKEIKKIEGFKKIQEILIVDDDVFIQGHLKEFFEEKGYKTRLSSNGKDALKKILDHPPDVVILDLMMPEVDGFSVLDQLRKNASTAHLPVIILSAKDLTTKERNYLQNAVHYIIAKHTVDRNHVLGQLENALRQLEFTKPIIKMRKPMVLVVEDNAVAAHQIQSALEEHNYTVHTAFGGNEAIQFVNYVVPDAVVLDLMMPDMDGFQVLEQIRSIANTADLPVLILTAKELTAADRARLKHNNVKQLIQKGSVDREQLVACVSKLITGKTKQEKPVAVIKPLLKIASTPSVDKKKITILISEDNPDNLFTITAILNQYEYSYISAGDGQEAVTKAKQFKPDIILMDVQLPVLSGLDAARQIKSNHELSLIPIIAVTAKAMSGDREKVIESGCDDYITKPIDPVLLIDRIQKWTQK